MTLIDIAAVLVALTGLGNMLLSVWTAIKMAEVHLATNSMKDELVAVTRSDAHQLGNTEGIAKGKIEGRAAQRAEDLS